MASSDRKMARIGRQWGLLGVMAMIPLVGGCLPSSGPATLVIGAYLLDLSLWPIRSLLGSLFLSFLNA